MGLTFVHIEAAKAAAKISQLFQSGKFSCRIPKETPPSSMLKRNIIIRAAAPMRPTTAGRSPVITPLKMPLLQSRAYIFTKTIIMMNEGSTTAKVEQNEPSTHSHCSAPCP